MRFLFHPLVVHFPVALWLTSFLFDLLYFRTKERFFARGSTYLVGLGLLGAGLSIALAFVDYIPLVAGGVGQAFVDRHRVHSAMAYATTALYAGMFVARWRWKRMPIAAYLGISTVAAVLIATVAYLGAEVRRVM